METGHGYRSLLPLGVLRSRHPRQCGRANHGCPVQASALCSAREWRARRPKTLLKNSGSLNIGNPGHGHDWLWPRLCEVLPRKPFKAVVRARIASPDRSNTFELPTGLRRSIGSPHKKPARQPETTVNGRNQSERQGAGQMRYSAETAGQGWDATQTLNP
jgi:hypothetical protein